MSQPRRKYIRLAPSTYATRGQYFSVTIGTRERIPYFAEREIAARIFNLILTGDLRRSAELAAACLMPDHAHLLVVPTEESLVTVIQHWKSYTTFVARQEFGISKLWQRSFYDHAVRKDEDIHTVARYILNNPLRAGLTTDWHAYPYAWSAWPL